MTLTDTAASCKECQSSFKAPQFPWYAVAPRLRYEHGLNVGFNADTLAAMKKRTNSTACESFRSSFSIVCAISIVARFTIAVATGLWPVCIVVASHTMETAHRAVATAVSANDPPAGSAKGSLTYDGATAVLKFAAAFVDQKDERKPIVLVISDQKLPVEKWESEFDMMIDHTKWSGVVFFLDKDGTFFRSDVHMNGRQSSVSGIFELKIDNPSSKDLTGTARASTGEKETKLDAAFHATLK
jgi:hypothetical protein